MFPRASRHAHARAEKGLKPKQLAFLDAFAECSNIKRSCMAVDVDRNTHYRWLAESLVYKEYTFLHVHTRARAFNTPKKALVTTRAGGRRRPSS